MPVFPPPAFLSGCATGSLAPRGEGRGEGAHTSDALPPRSVPPSHSSPTQWGGGPSHPRHHDLTRPAVPRQGRKPLTVTTASPKSPRASYPHRLGRRCVLTGGFPHSPRTAYLRLPSPLWGGDGGGGQPIMASKSPPQPCPQGGGWTQADRSLLSVALRPAREAKDDPGRAFPPPLQTLSFGKRE